MTTSRAAEAVAAAGAFGVGALVAVQARVNGDLSERLGGGLYGGAQTAFVQSIVGLAAASLVAVAIPSVGRAVVGILPAVRTGRLTRLQAAGGLGGAVLILSQTATVPVLGVALFTVAVVAGQTGAGLAVDRGGMGPAGPQPITGRRVAAGVLAVAAVVVAVSGRLGSAGFSLPLVLLCLVAGGAVSVQTALNGQVGRVSGSALAAAWLNFAIAAVALGLAVLLLRTWHPLPAGWWRYTGGLMGLAFVAVVAAAVRFVGVLVVTLATVAGQVIGSLLLDALAPAAGTSLQAVTVLGAALTVVAVVVAAGDGRGAGGGTVRR